jgi:hypothetical protein
VPEVSTAGKRSALVRTERTELEASDFAKEIRRLEEGAESYNFLIYGDSNAGKTRLAGTAPGKVFWFVAENGSKSAARAGATGRSRRITDAAVAWAGVKWLEEPVNGKPRYEHLDWLIIDGASTLQDRVRLGYTAEAFDIDSKTRQHRNLPDRPDYFNTQNFFKAWIARIVDMPVNVIITAHAYRTDNTDDGELLVFPGFQGKVTEVANSISGLMDVTAYMEAKRLRTREGDSRLIRRLWFESPQRKNSKEDDVRYIAGEKFGSLGTHMDAPTIPKMLAKIESTEEGN